jgi:hypothetical protein
MPAPKFRDAFHSFWKTCQLWWQDWSNQVTVALLSILLTLTIVLAPIAYFGLLQVATDLSHGLHTGMAGFWAAVKKHWKQALPWGLASLGSIGPLGFGFWYFAINPATFSLFGLILCAFGILVLYTLSQLSAACYFLQEPQTLSLAVRNAWALLLLHPAFLLASAVLSLGLSLISVRFYLPLFLGVEALLALFSILQVQRTLGKEPGFFSE